MSASLSSAPDGLRAAARCAHFGSCGGCSLQDKAYEEQLALKARRVAQLLSPLGVALSGIRPSPEAWHYRNKMEFSFGDVYPPRPDAPWLKLGLKPKGRWYEILDLQECHLLSPETPALLAAVRAWAEREKVLPFNNKRQTGTLRHLVVREAKNGADRMVLLVTAPGEIPEASFVSAVLGAYPATTVLRGVNGKRSDTAVSDALKVLHGPGYIVETLRLGGRDVSLRVSPHSFFQTNTRGAQALYGLLRSWLKELGPKRVLDLYCGGGGIALSVADLCESVRGVELNASAIEDARGNAALNGLSSVEFYHGAAETLLPSLLAMAPEVVVADPPRAGLHPQALSVLLEAGVPHLIYVSCNPEALARDLKALLAAYDVLRCESVDLFPHTEHVETAALLKRRVPAML